MLKILHFADLHLGAAFSRFGRKGGKLREGLKHTLANIVNTAQNEGVNLVIIAGDLTDSNLVAPATVDFITSQLKKLDVPVVVLPGTHDCLDKSSVYNRQDWDGLDNLHIFKEESGQTFRFPSLSLAVHGKANRSNKSTTGPLQGLAPDPEYRWNIAVAHGSLQIEGKSAEDDFPITFNELASCGMDYVALGHWHEYLEHRSDGTTACYPGSAGTLSFTRPDSGTVNLVELADSGVNIKRIPVSFHMWLHIQCTPDKLEEVLQKHQGPQFLINLKAAGNIDSFKQGLLDELYSRYKDNYFYLNIAHDQASAGGDLDMDYAEYPENTFAGQFLMLARAKIDAASPEEKTLLEKALQEGYRILTTGEVNRVVD